MINYQNKWCLITGASAGIGKTFAYELAKRGVNLVLVARNLEALTKNAEEIKSTYEVNVKVFAKDIAQPSAPLELYNEVQAAGIFIDILINNAGVMLVGKFDEIALTQDQEQLRLNVLALSALTHLFLKDMLARKSGVIVNISSTAAFQPIPYIASYAASKAFVLSLTEALWAEYSNTGVQFLAVCPGPTRTNLLKGKDSFITKPDTTENVVATALKALNKTKMHVITGPVLNRVMVNLNRLLPRKTAALVVEKISAKLFL